MVTTHRIRGKETIVLPVSHAKEITMISECTRDFDESESLTTRAVLSLEKGEEVQMVREIKVDLAMYDKAEVLKKFAEKLTRFKDKANLQGARLALRTVDSERIIDSSIGAGF